MPASLKIAWRSEVADRLSAPTVAGGKVFVADIDGHRVCALDAASGEAAWQFTAGARVDSPPASRPGKGSATANRSDAENDPTEVIEQLKALGYIGAEAERATSGGQDEGN